MRITLPSKGMGSGLRVFVVMNPRRAGISSISSLSFMMVRFKLSHENGSVRRSSTGMTRKPPLALCADPPRIMV